MTNSLLDNEKDKLTNAKEEDILWKGRPAPPFVIAALSNGGHHDVRMGGTSPFVLVLMAIIVLAYILQQFLGTAGIVIAVVVGLYLFIRPNLILSKRKQHTTYYILKDGIYFEFWGWKKEQSSFVPFSNIKRISPIVMKTGKGDIMLHLKEDATFTTYDFVKNAPLSMPTLLEIPDVKAAVQIIKENFKS